MAVSKAGSFNAYLEFAQRNEKTGGDAPLSGPTGILTLLKAKPSTEIPLGELAEASQLKAGEFRDSIKKLLDSGFIELAGPAMSETVKLSAKGTEVAQLL